MSSLPCPSIVPRESAVLRDGPELTLTFSTGSSGFSGGWSALKFWGAENALGAFIWPRCILVGGLSQFETTYNCVDRKFSFSTFWASPAPVPYHSQAELPWVHHSHHAQQCLIWIFCPWNHMHPHNHQQVVRSWICIRHPQILGAMQTMIARGLLLSEMPKEVN